MRLVSCLAAALALAACGAPDSKPQAPAAETPAATQAPANRPDVMYVPTGQDVVDAMLKLGEVKAGDVLYDLGSGDGRIPITAARQFGIRAVGVELNDRLIAHSEANAKAAGVDHLVSFRKEDLFTTDFSEASVVTLFLLDSLNEKLRPRLLAELKPGTRILSHDFLMGDWQPEKAIQVGRSRIYLWTVPERKSGLPWPRRRDDG
jgi:SAM-dependent methyltransferase